MDRGGKTESRDFSTGEIGSTISARREHVLVLWPFDEHTWFAARVGGEFEWADVHEIVYWRELSSHDLPGGWEVVTAPNELRLRSTAYGTKRSRAQRAGTYR